MGQGSYIAEGMRVSEQGMCTRESVRLRPTIHDKTVASVRSPNITLHSSVRNEHGIGG